MLQYHIIIGAIEDGKKELLPSWLKSGPKLCIGDGALGFSKAIAKAYPDSRWQRCWVYKTANILNKLPKRLQSKAKQKIHEIWHTDGVRKAERLLNDFTQAYEAKYLKAVKCLEKDRDALLTSKELDGHFSQ